MRFVVVVAMYNMAPRIEENIRSLKSQSLDTFRCLIGDDLSTDDSIDRARAGIGDDERFQIAAHTEKKSSMGNIATPIECAAPDDDEIIVLVDGDDHLAHEHVLQRVADAYRRHGCWMTYGSYSGPNMPREAVCRSYPRWAVRYNLFRALTWRASHLKTFKYGLWKRLPPAYFTITTAEFNAALRRALLGLRWRHWRHWRRIDPASLLSPCGQYIRRCDDKAMTLPMLELAGERSRFIDEVLYIYNAYTKDLDFGRKPIHQKWYTRLIADIVRHKPRLRPLAHLN
jgi:glycosyltransferase involved in cell wall biosynthesis